MRDVRPPRRQSVSAADAAAAARQPVAALAAAVAALRAAVAAAAIAGAGAPSAATTVTTVATVAAAVAAIAAAARGSPDRLLPWPAARPGVRHRHEAGREQRPRHRDGHLPWQPRHKLLPVESPPCDQSRTRQAGQMRLRRGRAGRRRDQLAPLVAHYVLCPAGHRTARRRPAVLAGPRGVHGQRRPRWLRHTAIAATAALAAAHSAIAASSVAAAIDPAAAVYTRRPGQPSGFPARQRTPSAVAHSLPAHECRRLL